ncbi:hypothetical protein NL676_034899 [Syzygium grande]|nr:hypothetical protein NL676_034899 [Syzygium grande]
MSADSTSWGSTEHEYDVFLSFRGLDTRKGIADQEHPMGSQFGLQLLHAIARSKISIPVLSESHASSEWCLRELVQMVENRKNKKNTRHQTGRLGEAFHSDKMYFEQRDVEAGQRALRDVSFLKGWESEKIANGHLGEFVRIVVETVLSELRQARVVLRFVAEHYFRAQRRMEFGHDGKAVKSSQAYWMCIFRVCSPTNLETQIFKRCNSWERIHSSIGKVKSLVSLDLRDCKNPEDRSAIKFSGSLKKLETLDDKYCQSLLDSLTQ